MMKAKQLSEEQMNARCEFLMSMGFQIENEDRSVSLGEMSFDFSATAMDQRSVLLHVMNTSFDSGFQDGANKIRTTLKNILDI